MTASSTTSAPTSTPPSVTAGSGWSRSSSPRSSSGCSTPPSTPAPAAGSGSSSPRPNAASGSTTSTCSTPSSGRGSSRSAPTSRIRPRCGSTVTSGPNAKPTAPASATAALANGFAACDDPDALQAICDRFGPADVQAFFDRWIDVIPTPFTADDRAAGYWWELSMRQVEVSKTLVFDDPRRARAFFEALVTDNIDIGRPERVNVVFGHRPPRAAPHQAPAPDPRLHPRHRRPHRLPVQAQPGQAIPQGRESAAHRDRHQQASRPRDPAPASSTCPNSSPRPAPSTIVCYLWNVPVRAVPSALRSSSASTSPTYREGQRTGALRFGDPRAMALTGALCCLRPRRRRLHQPEPSRARRRTARPRLQHQPDDLRPAPPPPPRAHRTHPAHQHLHPHPRRHPRRRVLHQGPRPRPPTTHRRARPTTRTDRTPTRPRHHRPHHRQLRHQRPPRTAA